VLPRKKKKISYYCGLSTSIFVLKLQSGMVVCAYNSSTQKTEAGGSQVQSQPVLYIKIKTILSYIARACLSGRHFAHHAPGPWVPSPAPHTIKKKKKIKN
jgi:hypothetical protein